MQVIVYQNTSWDLCFLWSCIRGAFMLKPISTVEIYVSYGHVLKVHSCSNQYQQLRSMFLMVMFYRCIHAQTYINSWDLCFLWSCFIGAFMLKPISTVEIYVSYGHVINVHSRSNQYQQLRSMFLMVMFYRCIHAQTNIYSWDLCFLWSCFIGAFMLKLISTV